MHIEFHSQNDLLVFVAVIADFAETYKKAAEASAPEVIGKTVSAGLLRVGALYMADVIGRIPHDYDEDDLGGISYPFLLPCSDLEFGALGYIWKSYTSSVNESARATSLVVYASLVLLKHYTDDNGRVYGEEGFSPLTKDKERREMLLGKLREGGYVDDLDATEEASTQQLVKAIARTSGSSRRETALMFY